MQLWVVRQDPLLSIDILEYQWVPLGCHFPPGLDPTGLYQADLHRGQSLLSQCPAHNLCLATSPQASELHHLSFTEGSSCTLLLDQSRRNPDPANLILAPVEAGL